MKYVIKIEVGATLPLYTFQYVADRYAAKMIDLFPELEWCDVEVHEAGKPQGKCAYNRNPPPLRRCDDCKHVFKGEDHIHGYCKKTAREVMLGSGTCGDFEKEWSCSYYDNK